MEDLPPDSFEPAKAATQLTLADVIAALPMAGLPPRRLMDLQSAIRTICRYCRPQPRTHCRSTFRRSGASLDRARREPKDCRGRPFRTSSPVSGRRLLQVVSRADTRTAGQTLAPAWAMMLRSIEDKGPRTTLSRLARFCSARGIAPEAVNDAVFAEFANYLQMETLGSRSGKVSHQSHLGLEYRLRDGRRAFPGRRLPRHASGRVARRHSFSELPASFEADLEAHLAWAAVTDPFDPNARSRPLKVRTRALRRDHVQSAIDIALNNGVAPESLASLEGSCRSRDGPDDLSGASQEGRGQAQPSRPDDGQDADQHRAGMG